MPAATALPLRHTSACTIATAVNSAAIQRRCRSEPWRQAARWIANG